MKKIFSIILLISWMILIYVLSGFGGIESSDQSGFFVDIFCKIFNTNNQELASMMVRKGAHLTEFFVLGLLLINYLNFYEIKHKYWLALFIGFLYACSDEIHQIFVPGRAGQITDVLIDTLGVLAGVAICFWIKKIIKSKNKKIN